MTAKRNQAIKAFMAAPLVHRLGLRGVVHELMHWLLNLKSAPSAGSADLVIVMDPTGVLVKVQTTDSNGSRLIVAALASTSVVESVPTWSLSVQTRLVKWRPPEAATGSSSVTT
jgi:hypothetical protein